jgi:His/Glu/Gln/Arg/opine family amino acid ABC transporter permease subunit
MRSRLGGCAFARFFGKGDKRLEAIRAWGQSLWEQFDFNLIQGDRYKMLLDGLGVTLQISMVAALIGVVLGCVVALMRLSGLRIGRWYPLRTIARVYVDAIRGTPVVVQLMIMYYIIMLSYKGPKVTVAILSFGLNSAAYVSEMVRGGILSVDKGQTEAGRSLGLSNMSTLFLIVLPQAVKNILPSLFNEFIMLLKETSVVGYIAMMDLAKAGDYIRSRTFSPFFPLLTVAAIYLVMVLGLSRVFELIERRMRQSDHR